MSAHEPGDLPPDPDAAGAIPDDHTDQRRAELQLRMVILALRFRELVSSL